MFKKSPHKRRVKNILRQISFFAFIFFFTLILLFIAYFFYLNKNIVINPLAVLGTQSFSYGDKVKEMESLFAKNGIQASSIAPSENNTMLVTLKEGGQVIFTNDKNIEQQISSLQLIVRQLTIEGKRFNRIDFRFDNPVVNY